MKYEVMQRDDGKWIVEKISSGNTVQVHDTKADAELGAQAAEDTNAWISGNPGYIPLHESLGALAEWVDYEASVVDSAAKEIGDDDIAKAAVSQAEAMTEASAALSEAAKAAADTAAESFVEDGIPAVDKAGESSPEGGAIGGNPLTFGQRNVKLQKLNESGFFIEVDEFTRVDNGETGYAISIVDDNGLVESWEDVESLSELASEMAKIVEFDKTGHWDKAKTERKPKGNVLHGNPIGDEAKAELQGDLAVIDRLIAHHEKAGNAEAVADAKKLRAETAKSLDLLNSLDLGNPFEGIAEVIPDSKPDSKPDVAPESTHFYTKKWGKRS